MKYLGLFIFVICNIGLGSCGTSNRIKFSERIENRFADYDDEYIFYIVDTFSIERPVGLMYKREAYIMSDTLLPKDITVKEFKRISKMNPPEVYITHDFFSDFELISIAISNKLKFEKTQELLKYVDLYAKYDLTDFPCDKGSRLIKVDFSQDSTLFVLAMVSLNYINTWRIPYEGFDPSLSRGKMQDDIYVPVLYPTQRK